MFKPSALGTRQYWESFYETEIKNFSENGDVGEIWFGRAKEKQALTFCQEVLSSSCSPAVIMDVGCGNGHLSLFLSRNLKHDSLEIVAVDYSLKALELSRSLLVSEKTASSTGKIPVQVEHMDMTSEGAEEKWTDSVTVAIDKGTYDAISLCPEGGRDRMKIKYRQKLHRLVKDDGYLLIFSCNWTEAELDQHFTLDRDGDEDNGEEMRRSRWTLVRVLPSPSFSFGGAVGKNVTALVFQKRIEK